MLVPQEGPGGPQGFCSSLKWFLCYIKVWTKCALLFPEAGSVFLLASPSAASRCLAACPSFPARECVLLDLEMNRLPLKAAAASTRVSLSAGLSGSCPEGLFCCRSHFCIPTAFLHSSYFELRIYLQPWIQSRELADESPPLWCFTVSSGVCVPSWRQWLRFRAITGCFCIRRALLWLSALVVANQGDPGTEAIWFSCPSPYKVSLPFWEDEAPYPTSLKRLSGKFSNTAQWQRSFTGGLAYKKVQSVSWWSISVWQIKYWKTCTDREGRKDLSHFTWKSNDLTSFLGVARKMHEKGIVFASVRSF